MTVVIIILVIIALIVVWLISMYNNFVRLRNQVDNAWAQIDVQLQRRLDLIPNLVETVKGYAQHEKSTFEAVVNARNAAASATTPDAKMEADNQLTGALRQLFAVAEAYPDLKANTNFQDLQAQLTDTEDKISYMRQSYNDVVMKYNNALQTFPGNIFAGMFGFQPKTSFDAAAGAEVAPKVDFGTSAAPAVNFDAQLAGQATPAAAAAPAAAPVQAAPAAAAPVAEAPAAAPAAPVAAEAPAAAPEPPAGEAPEPPAKPQA